MKISFFVPAVSGLFLNLIYHGARTVVNLLLLKFSMTETFCSNRRNSNVLRSSSKALIMATYRRLDKSKLNLEVVLDQELPNQPVGLKGVWILMTLAVIVQQKCYLQSLDRLWVMPIVTNRCQRPKKSLISHTHTTVGRY